MFGFSSKVFVKDDASVSKSKKREVKCFDPPPPPPPPPPPRRGVPGPPPPQPPKTKKKTTFFLAKEEFSSEWRWVDVAECA
eukprot:COSAG06_NODE_9557_length_1870_cov_9.581828_1_plen_80_part_10